MDSLYELIVENEYGEQLNLTEDFSRYITTYEGFDSPNANIIFTDMAGMDGTSFNSARKEKRNIVLTIHIRGVDVAANRLNLYTFFRTKHYCKLYYKNPYRDVMCEGYVESIETPQFVEDETMQVSILCPDPYLYSKNEYQYDSAGVIKNFTFPFSAGSGVDPFDDPIPIGITYSNKDIEIIYSGNESSGTIVKILNIGNTSKMPTIYNNKTGEFFGINALPNNERWVDVEINSNEGKERITITKLVNQTKTKVNGIRYKKRNSKWSSLRLTPGVNSFTYYVEGEENKTKLFITYRDKYEAV